MFKTLLKGSALFVLFALTVFAGTELTQRAVQATENPLSTPLLVAQSSAQTFVIQGANQMSRCRESAVYIGWTTGVSAGSVTIETAFSEQQTSLAYAGLWAPLAVVAYNTSAGAIPKQDVVQITGTYSAIRTRIDTAISNGTVNTWVVCN